jgi:starch-binding outer membrane protein, SusD/RagB family
MKLKNKIISLGTITLIGTSLCSCSDFLEIKPLNDIVLENFWNEKSDVENVVSGCYSAMQTSAFVDRCMVWGESRSDNMIAGPNIGDAAAASLANVFKENVNANNEFSAWTAFYNVINRCNTILKYAPSVAEKDPNYTQSDLKATQAEISALRDLCYFYLIRAYRDVPYYTYAFIDDNQNMQLPATKFDVVLDSLVSDLERVQDDALKVYPETKTNYNTGRITRDAIHAMLADMYLWKNDYPNCVKYADMVIKSKLDTYKKRVDELAGYTSSLDKLVNGYPLISDLGTGNAYGKAFTSIFCSGNSSESIFELTYTNQANMLSNWSVSYRYGNSTTSPGYMKAADFLGTDVTDNTFKVFHNKYDTRYYENMQPVSSTSFGINKYVTRNTSVNLTSSPVKTTYGSEYPKDYCYANWIIYRLTDVMLMKAEALSQMVNIVDTTGAHNSYNDSILKEAFNIVNAVNKRSYGLTNYSDSLKYTDYNTKQSMENLVLDERQRELMFEGKRWFDLVRRSRRDGNTTYLVQEVLRKYTENSSAVQSKLSKMDGIYWPYNEDELKVNPNLTQNPAFGSGNNSNYEVNK